MILYKQPKFNMRVRGKMKKRLRQILCLLISVMLIIGSVPIGVLAEEVTQPSQTQVANTGSMIEGGDEPVVEVPEVDVTDPEPTLALTESAQNLNAAGSMDAAQTMGTMAVSGDGNYQYDLANGVATITKYIGTVPADGIVAISTSIDGYKVVAIGAGAFNGCTTIEKIIVPITVTAIYSGSTASDYTFGGCSSLKEVVIPTSVKTIEAFAFNNTPATVKISGYAGSRAASYASEHSIVFNPLSFGVSLASSLPSGQNIGTDLTLTATATGGSGSLRYQFYYDLVKLNGSYSHSNTINDWLAVGTASFTPSEAGTYTFYVQVEDGSGTICSNIIDSFKVINQPLVTFTTYQQSPQYVGIPLDFTAAVTGGTAPYTYEFSYQTGTTKTVDKTVASTNDISASWNKTAINTPGTYTFYVKVKDSQGLETTKTIADYKIYDYLKIDSFVADKVSPQELGTELKLTATATGGKTETEYKFTYTLNGITEIIQGFSDASSVLFTPPKAGTYTFKVEATNAYGIVQSLDITNYSIQDSPEIGSFTAAKADGSPAYIGDVDKIVLKADGVAEGVEPYTYTFSYAIGSGTSTQITSGTSDNCEFTPPEAGTYTFYVEVKDGTNTTATRSVGNYVVYKQLGGTLTSDIASPQNRETTVKFTAEGSGGKATYKYQFFYKKSTETDYAQLTTLSTTRTISKRFDEYGTYQIKVLIVDANGIEVEKVIDYTINQNPMIVSLVPTGDYFYAGTPIELITAVDAASTTGLTLELSGKMGTKVLSIPTSTISSVQATNTFSYKPTEAGSYIFTVTLKNADGSVAYSKTTTSLKVLAEPSAKAVKVSKTSGVLLGNVVKLTATGVGGKISYQYKFYVKKPSDPIPVQINSQFSKTNYLDYTMTEVGEHLFYAEIKDANNQTSVNINDTASVPIKVTNPAVIADSGFVAEKVKVNPTDTSVVYQNDSVKLSAKLEDAKGVGTLTCVFSYKQGLTEVKIGNPVTLAAGDTNRVASATANFVPPLAGSYNLLVRVTDQQGSVTTKTISSYKVLPTGTSKAVKINKVTDLQKGDTITLTATASGGKTPYTYAFSVKEPGDTTDTPIKSGLEKTISYQFADVGEYTFYVKVTDVNGVVLATTAQTASQMIKVTNPPDLTGLTIEKDQTVGTHQMTPVAYENDTLSIIADKTTSTGVTPITYVFEAKLGTTVVNKQVQTDDEEFSYTPTKAGSYTFTVTATDSLGSKDSVKKSGYKILADVKTKSIKASKTTDLIVGDPIKLTATGSGGQTPYTYAFYYYLDDGTTPQLISSDPNLKTATFAPPTKGNYEFHVIVTDTNGVIATNYDGLDASTTATVGNPPVILSLIPDKAKGSAVYPGDKVMLTAKVKPGTGLTLPEFDFYYIQGGNRVTIPITTASTPADPYTAVATFEPALAGSYNLCVDVFDGTNTVTQKISSYKVLQGLAVKSFKTDKLSGVNISSIVKLTAVAAGGKSPYMYEFYYYYQEDTTPQIIKTYSTSATANFIPQKPGFYSLHVRVKDATGRVCTEAYEGSILDFEVVDYPIVKSLTPSLPSGQYVETPIELTATAVGGKTPYTYNFAYQLNGGVVTPIDATDNKASFKPTTGGTYTFIVTVQDDNGSPLAQNKIEKYLVYAEPTVKTLTVSKTTMVVGSSVSLKAIAEGGLKPWTYKFTYSKDGGSEEVIRNYSTTSSIYFVPKATGNYTVKVYLQDKNGHGAELVGDKTITVN
jgi:hypothetical protein